MITNVQTLWLFFEADFGASLDKETYQVFRRAHLYSLCTIITIMIMIMIIIMIMMMMMVIYLFLDFWDLIHASDFPSGEGGGAH